MVAGLSSISLEAIDPHIRLIDAWRDGSSIADLLELSFRDEGIDDNGLRMIRMLRNYGPFESILMEGSPGFVWVEDGQVLGNVGMLRNPTRRDTWVIGNVATHPAHRNRGIASALLRAIIHYSHVRGARNIALQVVEGNRPAQHLYEKHGFHSVGAVAYYRRASVRVQPVWHDVSAVGALAVRRAGWIDSENVWGTSRLNVPEELTYSEPFDERVYRLGLRWSLANFFSGNPDRWLVGEAGGRFAGAVRTRVNMEASEHHVELMLAPETGEDRGIALLEQALKHFEIYIGKPLLATQSRPHEASHAALQAMGFKPQRTLVHMLLDQRS
jgi:ribosomal protein S18 acetylase RimI-like enzyme